MVSGAGRKVFQPGEVLTASNVQNYLMDQAVQYYAGTAARGSAIGTATTEGMISYLADTNELQIATGTATWQNVSMIQSPNYIINGAFDIWQRGNSGSPTDGYGSADRWKSARGTITKGTFTPGSQVWADSTYYANFSYTSQAYAYMSQPIENIQLLSGKTLTLSFYAKSSTSSTIYLRFNFNAGTGGSGVSGEIWPTTFTTTTSWTKFIYTFTVPSVSGATLGPNNTTYFDLGFFGSMSSALTGNFDIANIQLEAGQTATPFRRAGSTIQGELAACKRYYEKSYALDVAPGTANTGGSECHFVDTRVLTGGATYRAYGKVTYKVEKRATPTLTFYSQAGTSGKGTKERAGNAGTTGFYNAYVATSTDTSGSPGPNDTSTTGVIVSTDVGGSLPTTSWVTMHWVANAEL